MLDCLSNRWGWRAVDEVAKQKGNKIWHFDKRNRNGKARNINSNGDIVYAIRLE